MKVDFLRTLMDKSKKNLSMLNSTIIPIAPLIGILLAFFVALPHVAFGAPVIESVSANSNTASLIITGSNLKGNKKGPKVTLDGSPLVLTSVTASSITATLPSTITAGDYFLVISNSSGTASWDLTIGDTGPQGPQGPAGPPNPNIITNAQDTIIGVTTYSNTNTGYQNTAVGADALSANTSGHESVAVGYQALYSNTTGNGNTATGYQALYSNMSPSNTATGYQALYNNKSSGNNTAIGYQALYSNNATFNTASGSQALYGNTSGSYNTANGAAALPVNENGSFNTAIGALALQFNTTGSGLTAVGYGALDLNSGGNYSTAIGWNALAANTNGSDNTAIGYQAGENSTGSNNIYIGYNVQGLSGDNNVTRIGNGQTQAYIAGIYGATASGGTAVYINNGGQLGTATSSRRYKEHIEDMGDASSALMKLRPVTFRYKPEYSDGDQTLQYGLIAEEVAEVYPGLVQYGKDGQPYTVSYQLVNAMLLNEVQKQQKQLLTQNEEISTLKGEVSALKEQQKELAALKEMVLELSARTAVGNEPSTRLSRGEDRPNR